MQDFELILIFLIGMLAGLLVLYICGAKKKLVFAFALSALCGAIACLCEWRLGIINETACFASGLLGIFGNITFCFFVFV
ncbi:MAG: hypothetical protein RSD04_01680 [Clostridia bacterium]